VPKWVAKAVAKGDQPGRCGECSDQSRRLIRSRLGSVRYRAARLRQRSTLTVLTVVRVRPSVSVVTVESTRPGRMNFSVRADDDTCNEKCAGD